MTNYMARKSKELVKENGIFPLASEQASFYTSMFDVTIMTEHY